MQDWSTWVVAAYSVMAMYGTACQTTSSQISRNASQVLSIQEVLVMSPKTCSWVSSQLMTP